MSHDTDDLDDLATIPGLPRYRDSIRYDDGTVSTRSSRALDPQEQAEELPRRRLDNRPHQGVVHIETLKIAAGHLARAAQFAIDAASTVGPGEQLRDQLLEFSEACDLNLDDWQAGLMSDQEFVEMCDWANSCYESIVEDIVDQRRKGGGRKKRRMAYRSDRREMMGIRHGQMPSLKGAVKKAMGRQNKKKRKSPMSGSGMRSKHTWKRY